MKKFQIRKPTSQVDDIDARIVIHTSTGVKVELTEKYK